MGADDNELLTDDEPALTPDDGYRLMVRLMRRYIDRQRAIAAQWKRVTPFGYSKVRFQDSEDCE
jgi:hypothetical protein